MSIKLSPSMLSIDFGKVAEQLKIVEDAGYKLIDELYFASNKSSHFNRKKDGVNLKTEKESMLVLELI